MPANFDGKSIDLENSSPSIRSRTPILDQKHLHSQKPISVLLVENNPGDARLITLMLAEASSPRNGNLQTMLVEASCLNDGLARLAEGDFDIILLDRSLPDSTDDETLMQVRQQSPDIPVVLLTGLDDELSALAAVRGGAQDYLVKGKFNTDVLARAVRYGIERQRLRLKLEQSEKLFRTMVQKSADGLILVVDKSREILYINPAAEALLESQADQLLGSTLDLPLADDKATIFELDRENEATTVFVEFRTVKTEWKGQSVCVVSLRDITAHK